MVPSPIRDFLDLHERACLRARPEHRSGAKVTEGPDQRLGPDLGVDRDHVRADLGAGRDPRRAAEDVNGWTIASASSSTAGLDPGRRRVDDRDAGDHVREVDPVAQRGRRGGELGARVHALGLVRVGGDVSDDALAAADEVAHGVGQVELALGVVRGRAGRARARAGRPGRRRSRSCTRRARAARESRRRPRRSPRTVPSAAADDPAVRADVRRLEGEHGRGGVLAPVRLDELLEQLGRQKRRVAREDEQLARAVADRAAARSGRRRRSRAAAPAPRRRRPANASRLSGEAITTSGSGPSGRAASSTQSTMRRPRIGCRCFGTAERMRVPSPPAITTAASEVFGHGGVAGAPGFEPGITGPKPVALPLGHAPRFGGDRDTYRRSRSRRTSATTASTTSATTANAVRTSARTGTSTTASCETARIQDPSRISSRRAVRPVQDVERDGGDREEDDDPPLDRADEHEDALDDRRNQRDLEPVLAQRPAETGAAVLDRQRPFHATSVAFSRTRRERSARRARPRAGPVAPRRRDAGGGRGRRRRARRP